MLREVRNKHIKPRIVPFRVRLSGTAAFNTILAGYGDYTFSRASTGVATLTEKIPFSRNGFIAATPENGVGDGGYYGLTGTSGTGSAFGLSGFDANGNATDSRIEGFTFGWDSSDVSLCKFQRVTSALGYPRVNWGKITGATGAVAIGTKDFSCTRVSTGVYTINFLRSYSQIPYVLISPIASATSAAAVITTVFASRNGSSVNVGLSIADGTSTDIDFYVVVIGSDSRSDAGKNRTILQNSQRKPRIIACQITNTAGTPSLTIGGATGGADFGSLVDNGTGDFSVTIQEPFKREPAILVFTTGQRSQVHSYSANVVRVLTKDATGANADVTGVTHIICIGSDDATEF